MQSARINELETLLKQTVKILPSSEEQSSSDAVQCPTLDNATAYSADDQIGLLEVELDHVECTSAEALKKDQDQTVQLHEVETPYQESLDNKHIAAPQGALPVRYEHDLELLQETRHILSQVPYCRVGMF